MKFRVIAALSLLAISNINTMDCPNGTCPLLRKKVILTHRVINPNDKIVVGYKVSPTHVTAMLHLPTRPMHWFANNPKRSTTTLIKTMKSENSFDSNIQYGLDNINFSVRDGKFVTIVDRDFTNRVHRINTQLPQLVGGNPPNVQVLMHGNTVEIKMPRTNVGRVIRTVRTITSVK